MNLSIEKLSYYDVDPFCKVLYEVLDTQFPGYKPEVIEHFKKKSYTPANFRYWLNEDMKTVLVARIDDEIVGFAVIDGPYGGVSLCRWLGILPEYQRKGIGRKLIDTWKIVAVGQNCHKLELAAQPTAKEFYEKVGLELEGKRTLSYFGIDQYIFGKLIGKPDVKSMI